MYWLPHAPHILNYVAFEFWISIMYSIQNTTQWIQIQVAFSRPLNVHLRKKLNTILIDNPKLANTQKIYLDLHTKAITWVDLSIRLIYYGINLLPISFMSLKINPRTNISYIMKFGSCYQGYKCQKIGILLVN